MELKTLKNVTSFDHSIVFKGTKITLESGDEETLPADVADLFLKEHDGLVQEVKVDEVEAQFGIEEPMWIANVTGAPWLKEQTVRDQYYDQRERRSITKEMEMENAKPITVSRQYDPGMQEYRGQDGGLLALNLFKKTLTIPPFKRLQVPEVMGRWLLKRDRQQARTMQGCLIKSRKPTAFEPDTSWDLDEIRMYLKYLNPKEDLGRSQAQIEALSKGDQERTNTEVRNAKKELMKKLYYYLVSPSCSLPSRREFEEWRKGAPLTDEEEFGLTDVAEWERQDTRAVSRLKREAQEAQ